MTTQEKLARIHNRATCYELALINGDRRILICYSMRQGRHTILEACRKHGQAIVDLTCPHGEQNMVFLKPASLGATIGDWWIRFTGRTQREAIITGELPWIGDVKTEVAA